MIQIYSSLKNSSKTSLMECNPTEFIEEKKSINDKKEISITTQVTFDLSLAGEEQCELLTFTVIF